MEHDKSANYNKNFDYTPHQNELDGQRPNIDLSVGIRLQNATTWSNRFLSVTLSGTNVSADGMHNPPHMAHDDGTHRGWYTESVLVTMWLSDPSVARKNDGPVTTGSSINVSSGTSEQLSGNIGAMGEQLMIGIQGGIGLSQSFSQNIPNFRIVNNSNAATVSQLFALASTSGGHYHNPHDLKQQKGPLGLPHLVGLPAQALAGLAISSEAIFATPDAAYDKKVTLNVQLEHTLARASMHRYGIGDLSSRTHGRSQKFQWNAVYDIDFAEVNS